MTRRLPVPALAVAVVALTLAEAIGGSAVSAANTGRLDPTAAIGFIGFLAFPAMGLLVLHRHRRHPIGWLLLAVGVNVYVIFGSADYAEFALIRHHGSIPFGEAVAWISGWGWIPFILMVLVFIPMLFPDGRLPSSRWVVAVISGLIFGTLAFLGNSFSPGPVSSTYPGLTNPITLPAWQPFLRNLIDLSVPFGLFALIASLASVVVRYRRAESLQRRQLRWFLFAVVVAAVPFILNGVVPTAVDDLLVVVLVPLLPISIAIAVLRYRLYDIDVVINRALVYGALAAFITAVYVGIVVGIGSLIGSRGKFNLALSILATAVVAVAFQPVRTRVQALANRLVYGYRATPYEALTQFSHRVAGAYASEEVLPRLARVLVEGTGAMVASVWLNGTGQPTVAATWPETATPLGVGEADRVAEVRHQGETLGELTVRKRAGEPFTPVEEKLLNDLAAQAGQVLRNVRLTSELQARLDEISAQAIELRASRQRIVSVQDAERRRLERNIHDGAQQHLVALAVKLRLAATLARRDPAKARQSLKELETQTAEARQTLRDLAQGIYPAALREGGLVEALGPHAEVSAHGVGRYDPEIEAGVYFSCLEAVQNATKYAKAARVRVDLRQQNGHLLFSVIDDGVGFDPKAASGGTGVQNMKDRVASLGGRLSLESQPGKGTTVSGLLPLATPTGAER